ncbi:MAG: DUF3108 domain-containing protein [Myxococcota bacterium]
MTARIRWLAGGLLLAFAPAASASPTPTADARGARLHGPAFVGAVTKARPEPPSTCTGINLPFAGESPFKTGEELSYDLSASGLYIGKFEIKVGKPRGHGKDQSFTLFGRGRTTGIANTLKPFSGRYMVLDDPDDLEPRELRTESTYGDDPRTEETRFSPRNQGIAAKYLQNGTKATRTYPTKMPAFDLLTLLYYGRRLALKPGMKMCHEVYADKRMWRMDVEVMGLESVSTPAGDKPAMKLLTHWVRMPHADFDPSKEPPKVDVEIYYSTDPSRAPLAFIAKTKDFTARGDLVRWVTSQGDGEVSWAF